MEEHSTSIASFWVTISLLLIFELISLILSFFIFIIIYASIVMAFSIMQCRKQMFIQRLLLFQCLKNGMHVMY